MPSAAGLCAAAQHQPLRASSTATAAAKKSVAAFTAVQENIQEKELHVEASESYLAVSCWQLPTSSAASCAAHVSLGTCAPTPTSDPLFAAGHTPSGSGAQLQPAHIHKLVAPCHPSCAAAARVPVHSTPCLSLLGAHCQTCAMA